MPAIDLVDGEALAQMLKEFDMGVETEMIEKMTIQPGYFSSI